MDYDLLTCIHFLIYKNEFVYVINVYTTCVGFLCTCVFAFAFVYQNAFVFLDAFSSEIL